MLVKGCKDEMHIASESPCCHTPNTILTKCSKMTEEKHKRPGINGNADGAFTKDNCSTKINYNQGGRLKFFKDGKFILELERAREGERVSWVSVPRKTFWPPQGTAASTPTYRQESSTSLSVSDDNSSIQSSPWQRDHSWKQTTPQRNQSKEMSFYFWHPKCRRVLYKTSIKRRRPYSTITEDLYKVLNNDRTITKNNNSSVCNNKVISSSTSSCLKSSSTNRRHRISLLTIIQTLTDNKSLIGNTPPRAEMVVSPRKRFLREMEKDKVFVEDNCLKRSRNKPQQQQQQQQHHHQQQQQQISGTNAVINKGIHSPVAGINGGSTTTSSSSNSGGVEDVIKQPMQRNNSYSITSLLAEDRNVRKSPNGSPSHYNSVTHPQPPYCTSSTEDRLYSENVDRLRSIELSQADKRAYQTYPHPSYLPFVYPYTLSPYYNPGMYSHGRGYLVPPVYHAAPISMAIRHDSPSCSWNIDPQTNTEHIDENVADMPLNLSKH